MEQEADGLFFVIRGAGWSQDVCTRWLAEILPGRSNWLLV